MEGADTNLIKMFQLSQLTIEYLMESQTYLKNNQESVFDRIRVLETDLKLSANVYDETVIGHTNR